MVTKYEASLKDSELNQDIAHKIISFLSACQIHTDEYDQGGIRDPLDEKVIGDHYAATHFAWACALLFYRTGDKCWFQPGQFAIDFHIRTSPDEYAPGDWDYHWDFNNLAFIETYALLRDHLSNSKRERWEQALLKWKTNPHSALNWLAMRGLSFFQRGRLLQREKDIEGGREILEQILSLQKNDGALDDIPDQSRPSQYHAYTACLLHRMKEFFPARISDAVVRAARWLLNITSPDGDMNALGRGQGQIFGYASAVYLFRAASLLDGRYAPHYLWATDQILHKLSESQHEEGWLPLVINDRSVKERAGWYDYHHLSVYNAFAAVWLLLADEIHIDTDDRTPPPSADVFLPDSQILSLRKKNTFSLWAAGVPGHGYATEAGITPHILDVYNTPLFRYPVGPGPGKYGERVPHTGQSQNVWSPLVKDAKGHWTGPYNGTGNIRRLGDGRWRLTYHRDNIRWERCLASGEYFIEVKDQVHICSGYNLTAVRTANIAVKPEMIKTAGRNTFSFGEGHQLSLWGNGEALEKKGQVTATNGTVEIIAIETEKTTQQVYNGGWRLRKGPALAAKKANGVNLPGILCLSWDPWSAVWKRKQRLMYEMSRTGRAGNILYVEPPVTSTQVIEGYRQWLDAGENGQRCRRAVCGKLYTHDSHFHLFTSILPLPGQRSSPKIHTWNRKYHSYSIRKKLQKLEMDQYVLWLYHPSQVELLDEFIAGAELIVYDWTDDWIAAFPSHFPRKLRDRLSLQQETLLQRADVVFGVSEELCLRAKEAGPWVYHLPNATDTDVFQPAAPDAPSHPVYQGLSEKKKLVYLSQITDRVDFDLIVAIAERHPEWHIFLIGPIVCPEELIRPLRRFPNVHLPGPLPYHEAAQAVAQADACILPHKVDALTMTLDPIKLYDYLATGLPVVTTHVAMNPALMPYVEIANGPDAFEKAVQKAFLTSEPEKDKRRAASHMHIWKSRAATALDILDRFF